MSDSESSYYSSECDDTDSSEYNNTSSSKNKSNMATERAKRVKSGDNSVYPSELSTVEIFFVLMILSLIHHSFGEIVPLFYKNTLGGRDDDYSFHIMFVLFLVMLLLILTYSFPSTRSL